MIVSSRAVVILLSWNVLADSYIRTSYYPNSPPAVLARGARTEAVAKFLVDAAPDVACLQEVEDPVAAAVTGHGWDVRHCKMPGRREGCAIASKVKLLTDMVPLPHHKRAVLARGAMIPVATAHLHWDKPGTPRHQRQGIAEAEVLLAALSDGPWIVCGDLNVECDDDLMQLFHDAGFRDACEGALHPTANANGRARRIDHILVRGDVRCEALPVVPIVDDTPLPSATMPSDHVPIAVKLG